MVGGNIVAGIRAGPQFVVVRAASVCGHVVLIVRSDVKAFRARWLVREARSFASAFDAARVLAMLK